MLSVIVVSLDKPVAYKLDNDTTIGELIRHWIADTKQVMPPGRVQFLTVEGKTLENDCLINDIPVAGIGTRVVRAESKDAVRILLPSSHENEEAREITVPVFFTCTGLKCREEVANLTELDLAGFRLRYRNPDDSDTPGLVLRDEETLASQGISFNCQLVLEMALTGVVNCVSRWRQWTRKISFFPDQTVDVLLEPNIDMADQRITKDDTVIDLQRDITVSVAGLCPTDGRLDITLVLREPVVLETELREYLIKVWPEERVEVLFDRVEALGDSTKKRSTFPASKERDRRQEVDPLLLVDVMYPHRRPIGYEDVVPVKRKNDEAVNQQPMERCIYYRGRPIDTELTFASVKLPPFALLTMNPMKLKVNKPHEFEFVARVPYNASVGDLFQLLPQLRPELHVESFEICPTERRAPMKPMAAAISQFGVSGGRPIFINRIVIRR